MRTDLDIRDDVMAELEFEPSLDAVAIGVAVKDGVVVLSGHVKSFAEKIIAEEAVKRLRGVRAVAQEMEVRLPFDGKADDDELARRACNVLDWWVGLPSGSITVKVEDGRISLSGEVSHEHQRLWAENAVRFLTGVTGVSNGVTVKTPITAKDIQKRIRAALERHAAVEAAGIEVLVDGDKVTLKGKVKSWHERKLVETAAWSAPGVEKVVDQIHFI